MIGGNYSKTGLVMKKKGKKNRLPVLVLASPRTTWKRGEQQQQFYYINECINNHVIHSVFQLVLHAFIKSLSTSLMFNINLCMS